MCTMHESRLLKSVFCVQLLLMFVSSRQLRYVVLSNLQGNGSVCSSFVLLSVMELEIK